MNRSCQTNKFDFKDSKRINKNSDLLSPGVNNKNSQPEFCDLSSWDWSDPTISMTLRSRARCCINPFDLSSNCGDDDFLENKYSLRSHRKRSSSKLYSNGEINPDNASTIDLESIKWSEIDSFSLSGNIKGGLYGYLESDDINNKQIMNSLGENIEKNTPKTDYGNGREKPKSSFCYELRQRHQRNNQKYSNYTSPLPTIRDSTSNNIYIPEISNQTLVDLLSGRYYCYLTDYVIIDCRFPYEFDGGHIMNSKNLFTCRQLLQFFIGFIESDMEHELDKTLNIFESSDEADIFKWKAFIFYCEFSSFRGPKLAQCLRGLDRLANVSYQPRLKFPHVYVLHGGFNNFFLKFPNYCSPMGYVSMKQTPYSLRSPINPDSLSFNSSPTKYSTLCDQDSSKPANSSSPRAPDEITSTIYRKQQINCERQLRTDAKCLLDMVSAKAKNSDIIRLFKFEEVF